jgi:hypothetical protein
MDGFPNFGPLSDDLLLDPCNGIIGGNGNYRCHVRSIHQVDPDLEYCNGSSPETNWNYVLGCYSGSMDATRIWTRKITL